MSEVNKHPPISHDPLAAAAAITAINALDMQQVTIDEVLELLTPVFRGYQVETQRLHPGITLYRSRICDKPHHVSALLAPPLDIAPLGRANRDKNPVLYCCTSREAPFFEARPIEGQTAAIACWVTTAPLLVNHVGYTDESFRTLLSTRKLASWGTQPIKHLNPDVSAFLAKIFTRTVPRGSEHEYKLSAAIAEKLFADDMFDALLYPTIAMRANADNFALKLHCIEHGLQLRSVEFVRIDNVEDFKYSITILDTAKAIDTGGTILWKGRGDQWTITEPFSQLVFTAENGKWVARDESGIIVEPG